MKTMVVIFGLHGGLSDVGKCVVHHALKVCGHPTAQSLLRTSLTMRST